MVQAKQSPKAIATLGEKWQSFATSKLQQHQPQQKSLLFRESLLKKVTALLHKCQVDDHSDLQPLQSQFVTKIQQKYLTQLNKFQRQQHQSNLLGETTNNQDWWEDFDLLESPSPQFNKSTALGEKLGEQGEQSVSPTQQFKIVERLQKTTIFSQPQPSLTTIDRQIILNQKPSQLVNYINQKYSRVNYQPQTHLPQGRKAVALATESSDITQQLEQRELENKIEQSSYSNISNQLRNFLGNILNLRVPNVKIYSNQAADNYAKKINADAITYEDKVLLRTGKYHPQKPESIALLSHEITHAASLTPQRQNYQFPRSDAAEEQAALSNEKKVLNYFSLPGASISSPQPPSIPGSNISPASNFSQAPRATPKTAPEGRLNASESQASSPTLELSDMQIHRIADQVEPMVYTKICKRIQADFERGG
jgi:hypothetical protein